MQQFKLHKIALGTLSAVLMSSAAAQQFVELEAQAEADVRCGRVARFATASEAIAHLRSISPSPGEE